MTLTLGATGARSVYLSVDHRITWSDRFEDRGVKVASVRAADGVAIVGYAGLGVTAGGTQPSTWMHQLLHGRHLTIEGCVAELAIAVGQEFPQHVMELGGGHVVLILTVVEGQPRIYGIHLRDGKVGFAPLRQRHLAQTGVSEDTPPRAIYTGTGGAWFARQRDRAARLRDIYSMIQNHNLGRVSGAAVSSSLAHLNRYVADNVTEVSPSCTTAWFEEDTSGAWQLHSVNFDAVGGPVDSLVQDPIEIAAAGDGSLPLEFPGIDLDIDGTPDRRNPSLK